METTMQEASKQRQAEFIKLGLHDQLSQTLFKKNRDQFIEMMLSNPKTEGQAVGFFKGASEVPIYSSDVSYPEY